MGDGDLLFFHSSAPYLYPGGTTQLVYLVVIGSSTSCQSSPSHLKPTIMRRSTCLLKRTRFRLQLEYSPSDLAVMLSFSRQICQGQVGNWQQSVLGLLNQVILAFLFLPYVGATMTMCSPSRSAQTILCFFRMGFLLVELLLFDGLQRRWSTPKAVLAVPPLYRGPQS